MFKTVQWTRLTLCQPFRYCKNIVNRDPRRHDLKWKSWGPCKCCWRNDKGICRNNDLLCNPYHYEYWLDGNQEAGKQQKVANDNKNGKFGDTVTLDYNATLVYGKAEDTTTTESTQPSTEMTADEITNAFKNGTESGLRYDKVVVTPIKGMTNDMIRGVDITSYKSLENAGVTFYDFNGNPASLVKILHDAGVNYIRLRLWNDPYNASNQNYGGGVCDGNCQGSR